MWRSNDENLTVSLRDSERWVALMAIATRTCSQYPMSPRGWLRMDVYWYQRLKSMAKCRESSSSNRKYAECKE